MFFLKELKMSKITVKKLTEKEKKDLNVSSWPIWEKEVSVFPWHYDTTEQCFILEGKVVVTDTQTNESVEINAGDFVSFEKNLSCKWDIKKSIKKHYRFL